MVSSAATHVLKGWWVMTSVLHTIPSLSPTPPPPIHTGVCKVVATSGQVFLDPSAEQSREDGSR